MVSQSPFLRGWQKLAAQAFVGGSIAENWPATANAAGQFFSVVPTAVLMLPSDQFWFWFRWVGATVFVSLLAYYVIKLMAGARGRQFKRTSGNLQLIDSISVGLGTSVQIIKAGEKYIVISVSKERVTYLTEVEHLEFAEEGDQVFDPSQVPFGAVLAKFLKLKDQDSTGDEN